MSGAAVDTVVTELPWDDRLGGGWNAHCPTHGDIWTETTNNRDDLPRLFRVTERAALLHEDNNHAQVVADTEGNPAVS
jgi:hypothetical protein